MNVDGLDESSSDEEASAYDLAVDAAAANLANLMRCQYEPNSGGGDAGGGQVLALPKEMGKPFREPPPARKDLPPPLADIHSRPLIDVLNESHAMRRAGLEEKFLITLDELNLWPKQWPWPECPIFAHADNPGDPFSGSLSQTEYNRAFNKMDAGAYEILQEVNTPEQIRAVIAGGAAGWPLSSNPEETRPGDIDFFFFGKGATTSTVKEVMESAATKIAEARGRDTRGGNPPFQIATMLSAGLFTLELLDRIGRSMYKMQAIMREYETAASILYAFDMGPSAVLFDGSVTRFSILGALAYRYKINVVDPRLRSTTFEARLRKYMKRGFDLGLPHLPGFAPDAFQLHMPHITLHFQNDSFGKLSPNRRKGHVELPASRKDNSDYEPTADRFCAQESGRRRTMDFHNLRELARRRAAVPNRFWVCSSTLLEPGEKWSTPLAGLANDSHLGGFLQKPRLYETLKNLCDIKLRARKQFDIQFYGNSIQRNLGLSTGQLAVLANRAAALLKTVRLGGSVSLKGALEPFANKILTQFDIINSQKLDWWIRHDPGRQYTASLNPRCETPAEWYGTQNLAAFGEGEAAGSCTALPQAPRYPEKCSICRIPISVGTPNTIVLACGHAFHWTLSGSNCLGLARWYAGSNGCPVCRGDIDKTPGVDREGDRNILPLEIDWDEIAVNDRPGPAE